VLRVYIDKLDGKGANNDAPEGTRAASPIRTIRRIVLIGKRRLDSSDQFSISGQINCSLPGKRINFF